MQGRQILILPTQCFLRPLPLLSQTLLLEHPFDHSGQQIEIPAIHVFDNVLTRAQFHGLHGNLLVAAAGDHNRGRQ